MRKLLGFVISTIITLDDGKANAMNLVWMESFMALFTQAEKEAKAIVVTGKSGVFSGVFDLKWLARAEASSEAGLDRLMAQIDEQLKLSGLERGESVGH